MDREQLYQRARHQWWRWTQQELAVVAIVSLAISYIPRIGAATVFERLLIVVLSVCACFVLCLFRCPNPKEFERL